MIQSLEGMDLADRLREMSSRIRQRVDNVKTEEATKTALVMPFINHVLGYNVFDPAEVVPEFVADVGTKRGEKVDYAIYEELVRPRTDLEHGQGPEVHARSPAAAHC